MTSNLDNALGRMASIRARFAAGGPAARVRASAPRSQANITRAGPPVAGPNPTFGTVLAQQLQQQASLSGLSSLISSDPFGGASFDSTGGFGLGGLGGLGTLSGLGGLNGLGDLGLGGFNPFGTAGLGALSLGQLGGGGLSGLGAYGLGYASYRYNPFRELEVTSPFGERPALADPERREFHAGTDYSVNEGTPLPALGPGLITAIGDTPGGLGRSVTYRLDTGEEITYGHLTDATPIPVVVGQRVVPGLIVGLSGNTGASTGPHLHVEIRVNGESVDPQQYLRLLP